MPKIPNSRKIKNMKTTAFPRLGRDASKDPMSLLILGNALMDLRGLNTLNVLRAFKLAAGSAGMSSNMPMHTTKKSSQFHGSLRYEFLWKQNPMAIILITASKVKITVNIKPLASMYWFL